MHLPGPLRAAVGLVASAADEAKRLPDRALELPMLAVSTALQASVRAQQRYARLTARGDEVLTRSRPSDEPPEWAQFDEPVAAEDLRRTTTGQRFEQRNAEPPPVVEHVATTTAANRAPARKSSVQKSTAPKSTAEEPPATKAAAQKTAAKKSAAKKSAASATSSATAARKSAAKKAPPAAPAVETPPAQPVVETGPAEQPGSSNGKAINKPRHTAPSRFDDAADD